MRIKLLTSIMLFISPFSYSNELDNHSFILKNWSSHYESCLEYTSGDDVFFTVDCFANKPNDEYEKNKALKEIMIYKNNRIYPALTYRSDEKICLRASNSSWVEWTSFCDQEDTVFDIIPHSANKDAHDTKFVVKNRTYNKCLTEVPGKRTSLKSCSDESVHISHAFAAALKTPMIPLTVSNLNRNNQSVILEVKDAANTLIFEDRANNIEKSQPQTLFLPDFQSYLQSRPQVIVRAEDSRWGTLSLTNENLRTDDSGDVTVNNTSYNLLFKKNIGKPFKLNNTNFVYTEDQNSLEPYADDKTSHSLPKGAVIALFSEENFEEKNHDFNNVVFKFDSDGLIERGKMHKSVRVLRANEDHSFKIVNDKGGLTWVNESKNGKNLGTLTYSGLLSSGKGSEYSDDYGLYNFGTARNSKFRRGAVFCDSTSFNKPSCYMLKTSIAALSVPFGNPAHWQTFPFRSYNSYSLITKGELFYQRNINTGEMELWYSKQDGKLNPVPMDKKETAEWFFMGVYQDLLQ